MISGVRYIHTNLIARDWRRLSTFYQEVFGCEPVLPERHLEGEWLERGSGVAGARLQGVHLRLPGCSEQGPTLEIFQYTQNIETPAPAANRSGFGHIAFAVDDVAAAREAVLEAGGSALGTVESVIVEGAGRVTWTYMRDPEGNIIELQRRDPD